MPKLSITLITRNEAANIVPALESTRFANEWIVVDCGSTDGTVELARRWGAAVYVHEDWPGFGQQKNRALNYASGDWVLSLDADERVSQELAEEIQSTMADAESVEGYTIPRLTSYCGRFLRHGDWWPDRVLRLFRRGCGTFTEHLVHEGVQVRGRVRALEGHLVHYSYATLESVVEKMNAYSTAAAIAKFQKDSQAGFGQSVLHALWTFVRGYVLRRGFLDGRYGFLAAVSNAENTYYRYAKRWLMDQRARDASCGRAIVSGRPHPTASQGFDDRDADPIERTRVA
jgi:glycosyltransferase involved in cell wall biosynthesis